MRKSDNLDEMNKFLENYPLPQFTQDKRDTMNSLIANK